MDFFLWKNQQPTETNSNKELKLEFKILNDFIKTVHEQVKRRGIPKTEKEENLKRLLQNVGRPTFNDKRNESI